MRVRPRSVMWSGIYAACRVAQGGPLGRSCSSLVSQFCYDPAGEAFDMRGDRMIGHADPKDFRPQSGARDLAHGVL